MKAVVWNGAYDLSLQEVPDPVPEEGQVLIRSQAVGICGSDLEIYDGRFKQSVPPLIIGHEGCGIVEAVGPGVRKVRKGDRVSVECILYCGECEFCRRGQHGLCDRGGVMGMIGAQGEYAELFVAPEKNCHPLPENIDFREAALIDTLAGPAHGIGLIDVPRGSTVAVFGPGPAGLFFCRLAKLRGASRVYLVGTRDNRLELGPRYGADRRVNVGREEVTEVIRGDTGGRGVDIVIESAGSAKALNDGMGVLRKGGTLLIYGVFGGGPVAVDIQPIQLFELNIIGSCGLDYPGAIDLVSRGEVPVKGLVSHTFSLEQLPDAFGSGLIAERREGYMKGVVLFP